MKHLGTQTIETERLILRKFRAEDAQAMFNNWASDDEVTKFLTWPTYKNVDDLKKYIDYLLNNYMNNQFYDWAIEFKEIGEPIGSIGVVDINENTQLVHVGYCIGRAWWHMGITSEAFAAVIKFMFEKVGVNRIESRHDPNNPNSGRVMLKCGLKYEGTLRQADLNNQGICDAAWYGILRGEYFAKVE